MQRDPLSERVHLGKPAVAGISLLAVLKGLTRRAGHQRDIGGTAVSTIAEAQPAAAAQRASGSSFYLAMRILPKPQREAMYEIYSFCRRVDDVADDGGPRDRRLAQLQEWRADIDALYAGRPPAHLRELATAVRTFDLQREDFLAVIDGMEMDVVADIRAPDFATFDLYCDRVASAVGRLSVRVFGMEREAGLALAHHLGRALQMTNILRDLDEDADNRPALSAARGAGRSRNRQRRSCGGAGEPGNRQSLRACRRARRAPFRRSRQRSWRIARAAPCARRASWKAPTASCSTA